MLTPPPLASVQSKKEEELMKSLLLKIRGKVNTLPQFRRTCLMVITALTRLVGSLCFMLRFPMEVNTCKCFGLESFLLYTGRVHRNTIISSQLINLFSSTARPGSASSFPKERVPSRGALRLAQHFIVTCGLWILCSSLSKPRHLCCSCFNCKEWIPEQSWSACSEGLCRVFWSEEIPLFTAFSILVCCF